MTASNEQNNEGSMMAYLLGLLSLGLVLGFGIRSLYWSFGTPSGTCLNCDFSAVGFNGIDDIGLLSAADYSFGLIVVAVLGMVALNANAWKHTNGY